MLAMYFSLFVAQSDTAALADLGRWSVAFGAFFLALHFLTNTSQFRLTAFVGLLAIGGVFEATFGVTQSVLALGPDSFQLDSGLSRAFGTFGKPNSYAGYLAIVFFPTLWVGVYYLSRLPNTYGKYVTARVDGMQASTSDRHALYLTAALSAGFMGSSAIIFGGIVASYSRGAWLGVAVATIATLLLYNRLSRYLTVMMIPVLALLLLGGLSGILPSSFQERVAVDATQFRLFDASSIPITDENFAAAERMAHWQTGWRMFVDEPLLGVGAGNFNVRYPDYFVRAAFEFSRGHAHNYYIHTLAETGLVGLAAYLTLLLGLLTLAIVVIVGAPHGFTRMLALGAFGTTVAVSTHNVFENLHVLNLGVVISLVWVLIIVAHGRWRNGADELAEATA